MSQTLGLWKSHLAARAIDRLRTRRAGVAPCAGEDRRAAVEPLPDCPSQPTSAQSAESLQASSFSEVLGGANLTGDALPVVESGGPEGEDLLQESLERMLIVGALGVPSPPPAPQLPQ